MVLLQSSGACLPAGGKSVHVLHSHMSALEFFYGAPPPRTHTSTTLILTRGTRPSSAIRGRDAVEEYLACGFYPLSSSVSFGGITDGVTQVSRVKLPLAKFCAVCSDEEDHAQFLARVELE
jgi:hypothetical protein